jgi:hypothetical protein
MAVSIKRSTPLGGMLTVEAGGMTIPVDNLQEQTNNYELLEDLRSRILAIEFDFPGTACGFAPTGRFEHAAAPGRRPPGR